jgi:polar amino acid transport system substrate-binding protein
MKTLLTFTLVLAVTLVNSQTSRLNLASDTWPPFTDVSTKHAFALDLVHEALARAKVQESTTIIDFQGVMNGILSKKFDGSAALWYSPEREKYLLFSKPYLENRLILVGKKGSDVSATSLSQLKGKRIAVVGSYAYGPLQVDNINLVKGSSDQQNLERLLKGEADYMLADALLIEYLLKYQSREAAEFLEIGNNTLLRLPLYFAIRKEIPDAQKIVDNFNEEIKKMIVEGTYNKILQLNWIATDVDGDGSAELVLSGDKAGTQAPVNSYSVLSQSDGASVKGSSYVIEGKRYSDWDSVPTKYKVSQNVTPDSEIQGFGPVFKF